MELFLPWMAWSSLFIFLFLCLGVDHLLGDPVYSLHPIRLMGNLLSYIEKQLFTLGFTGYGGGVLLFLALISISLGVVETIHWGLNQIHWSLGWGWYLFVAYSLIALKDLKVHGSRVANATEAQDLPLARQNISMMVGRDTAHLDFSDCNRAAIESISENLVDAVIAPLFYLILFGVPGLVIFKVASTMDSMVGYRNEKYQYFGWLGARLDDVLNFIPARLTWLLISVSAALQPDFNAKKALKMGWTQHTLLLSPNAGWAEATTAGALECRLVGPIWRQGKLSHEAWLGAATDSHEVSGNDIYRMNRLANLCTLLFILGNVMIFGGCAG